MKRNKKAENPPISAERKPEPAAASEMPAEPAGREKSSSPSRLWSIVPGLIILLSALIYVNFDRNYIQCAGNENSEACQNLDGNLISKVDAPMSLTNANAKIMEVNGRISDTQIQLGNLTNDIYETKASYTNVLKDLNKARIAKDTANVKELTNTRNGLNELIEAQESQLEILAKKKEAAETELAGIQNQLSLRYASRMLWVFLTGVSYMLSIAAIAVAFFAIWNSLKDAGKNLFLNRFVTPAIFFIAAGAAAYWFASIAHENKEKYMSVILPMFQKSIQHEGSILIDSINRSNAFLFAAIIFLVAASCAILYQVQAAAADPSQNASEKATVYEKSKKYLQAILYVGAAMLVVGILRGGVLQQWHLSFVSNAQNGVYINSLKSFFESLLSVQAGFYSILLASIYFPVAYWIRENVAALRLEVEETVDKGLSFNLTDFLPKLLSVFSPILATPLGTFVGYFFGDG